MKKFLSIAVVALVCAVVGCSVESDPSKNGSNLTPESSTNTKGVESDESLIGTVEDSDAGSDGYDVAIVPTEDEGSTSNDPEVVSHEGSDDLSTDVSNVGGADEGSDDIPLVEPIEETDFDQVAVPNKDKIQKQDHILNSKPEKQDVAPKSKTEKPSLEPTSDDFDPISDGNGELLEV